MRGRKIIAATALWGKFSNSQKREEVVVAAVLEEEVDC